MELEKQVCSLELAKRFNELGVKQEALYFWASCREGCALIADAWHDEEQGEWGNGHSYKDTPHHTAFTVAELREILKQWTAKESQHLPEWWTGDRHTEPQWITYVPDGVGDDVELDAPTEADIRAKTLIYLIEHGLLVLMPIDGIIEGVV